MDEKLEATCEAQAVQSAAIDQATLTPLVQSALNSETVEVMDWDHEQLHGGIGLGTAIYRCTGKGHDQGQQVPWSLILKTLCPAEDNANVSAWNYYKREADAYQSGWLDDLPGGLAAPRSFGVVARHTGQLNGAYLVERSLPSWPWLSSGWLRGYIALSAPAIPLIRNSLDHPLVRRWLPGDASDRLFRLWEARDLYLDALDRLPQTLCHLDLFRRNLFARKTADGDYQTVVIDWAFAGRGAIGEELVPLVVAGVAFNEVDFAQAQALEDVVFEGYLEGLRDAGWRGNPRQVRLGYTAASLRFRFAELNRAMESILDASQHPFMEQVFGRSMEEIQDHWAQVGSLCDSLTDEARGLMDILG